MNCLPPALLVLACWASAPAFGGNQTCNFILDRELSEHSAGTADHPTVNRRVQENPLAKKGVLGFENAEKDYNLKQLRYFTSLPATPRLKAAEMKAKFDQTEEGKVLLDRITRWKKAYRSLPAWDQQILGDERTNQFDEAVVFGEGNDQWIKAFYKKGKLYGYHAKYPKTGNGKFVRIDEDCKITDARLHLGSLKDFQEDMTLSPSRCRNSEALIKLASAVPSDFDLCKARGGTWKTATSGGLNIGIGRVFGERSQSCVCGDGRSISPIAGSVSSKYDDPGKPSTVNCGQDLRATPLDRIEELLEGGGLASWVYMPFLRDPSGLFGRTCKSMGPDLLAPAAPIPASPLQTEDTGGAKGSGSGS